MKLEPAAICTLSPERLHERLAWIRDEILPHARRSECLANGLAWELEAAPGLVEKLDRLVALERECCDGIEFQRTEGAQPGWIRLEIRGVDTDAMRLPRARLAKASGLGVLGALLGCCAISLLASAVLGGAAAAGSARLEEPWAIAIVAVPGTAAAWWWLGRRAAKPPAGCGGGC